MMISGRCGLDIVQKSVEGPHNKTLQTRLPAKTKKRYRVTAWKSPRICDTARLGTVTLGDERCADPGHSSQIRVEDDTRGRE